MLTKERELLIEIAMKNGSVCVGCEHRGEKHCAEPWSGELSNSEILFLSINPAIDENECFPLVDDACWNEEKVISFFDGRFDVANGWVNEELCALLKNEEYKKPHKGHYWCKIKEWADELSKIKGGQLTLGKNYTLTECAHCKTKGEKEVGKALSRCFEGYYKQILELSPAKLIVVVGAKARAQVAKLLQIKPKMRPNAGEYVCEDKKDRTWFFVNFPGNGWQKTMEAYFDENPEAQKAVEKALSNI